MDDAARSEHVDPLVGDPWLREVSARLKTLRVDTVHWLSQPAGETVDVVYLDPMFPARRKSARVKKEMWLLQHVLDTPAPQLALAKSRRRVVVKRPVKAPPLEGRSPAFAIPGKTVRFDVYLP